MKKNKIILSIISLLVAIVFIVTFIAAVFPSGAANLNQQLRDAQNQKKAAQQQLSSIQSQKKTAQADKDKIDSEIASLNSQINSVQAELNETNSKLAVKEGELVAAEEACEQQFESFKTRARIMYENGPSTYMEILFSSGSFSEFLSNVEIIRNLLDYDNQVLEERKAVREEIAVQKAEIESIKAEQETRRQTLSEMQSTLKTKQAAQSTIIANLASQEEVIRKQVEQQEAEEARIQRLISQAVASQSATSKSTKSSTLSTITASGTGSMQWPCPSTKTITSQFGTREHPIQGVTKMHNGIDIAGAYGVDIVAADSGTVLFSGNSSSYGKYIVISHGNGTTTLYAHCSQLLVSAGSSVNKGQVIAKVGSTGRSTGPHLHFEVSVNGARQNPLNYVG